MSGSSDGFLSGPSVMRIVPVREFFEGAQAGSSQKEFPAAGPVSLPGDRVNQILPPSELALACRIRPPLVRFFMSTAT